MERRRAGQQGRRRRADPASVQCRCSYSAGSIYGDYSEDTGRRDGRGGGKTRLTLNESASTEHERTRPKNGGGAERGGSNGIGDTIAANKMKVPQRQTGEEMHLKAQKEKTQDLLTSVTGVASLPVLLFFLWMLSCRGPEQSPEALRSIAARSNDQSRDPAHEWQ